MVFRFNKTQKEHEIDLEPKEVLGPEIKNLNHLCTDFVKCLKLWCPILFPAPGVLEPRNREPRPHQYEGIKYKYVLHDAPQKGRLQVLPKLIVIIYCSKNTEYIETDILVKEIS